ncbi:MAG TPA: phosphatase PAP2 family protein [Oryzihumus sp.]|nr:phosphatase PAP2 family protein [Oryzihumus sp.]
MADPAPGAASRRQRYTTRAVLVAVALALVAVPFALLLLLVEDHWEPLSEADLGARDGLHRFALTQPAFVWLMRAFSDSGSALAWQLVMLVVVVWLLWRRLWRLALFVVVTTAVSSLLNTAVKAMVDRQRPVVPHPFVHEPGASFPSGHAQAAVVGYGVLLLVFLPVLKGVWRRVAVAVAVVMVLGIGFSRVALAAHYVSDVLAGFVLGGAWLAAMAALFSAWRVRRGRPAVHPEEGLAPEDSERLNPAASAPGTPSRE